jgi:hypothetical protein
MIKKNRDEIKERNDIKRKKTSQFNFLSSPSLELNI